MLTILLARLVALVPAYGLALITVAGHNPLLAIVWAVIGLAGARFAARFAISVCSVLDNLGWLCRWRRITVNPG